jgi:hypothetical protein
MTINYQGGAVSMIVRMSIWEGGGIGIWGKTPVKLYTRRSENRIELGSICQIHTGHQRSATRKLTRIERQNQKLLTLSIRSVPRHDCFTIGLGYVLASSQK